MVHGCPGSSQSQAAHYCLLGHRHKYIQIHSSTILLLLSTTTILRTFCLQLQSKLDQLDFFPPADISFTFSKFKCYISPTDHPNIWIHSIEPPEYLCIISFPPLKYSYHLNTSYKNTYARTCTKRYKTCFILYFK